MHNPKSLVRPSFFHHLHPPTIPRPQARLRYTLGAGGISVFLVLVLVLTGLVEMFYYVPTPEQAALSIQTITYLAPFGALIRSVHYWAAQLLVVVSVIHLLRVILTGAYAKPRRFNYLIGLLLLVLILFLDFSGYVLRWDEGIRWALVAGTNLVRSIPWIGPGLYLMLMGSSEPGPASLLRIYVWHILGLSLVFIFIGVWHLFRVRRDGGIAIPPPEFRSDLRRITRFELVRREALAALLCSAGLIILSLVLPAPIGSPIQESTITMADGSAPWFFIWVQQLLRLGSPFIFGVLLPLGVITWLAIVPYVLPAAKPAQLGKWFPKGNQIAQFSVVILAVLIVILTLSGLW